MKQSALNAVLRRMVNKYFLNYLRWLTGGEIEDEVLQESSNHRVENGKLKFNFKANVNPKDWRFSYGCIKENGL